MEGHGPPRSTRLSRLSRDTPRLMGRKLLHIRTFRPINIARARAAQPRSAPGRTSDRLAIEIRLKDQGAMPINRLKNHGVTWKSPWDQQPTIQGVRSNVPSYPDQHGSLQRAPQPGVDVRRHRQIDGTA